jgi:gamma-glutamylcyclotransferase (GGCT)/AIG2-like uncharacterized protein YtfP
MTGAANFFVYGSLLAEEVLQLLFGRVPTSSNAVLRGFLRHSITGKQYPIIIPTIPTDSVRGKVLHGITADETRILDYFESDEYDRKEVVVTTDEGKELVAYTYVATADTHEQLKDQLIREWDYEFFRLQHLSSFTQMCNSFKQNDFKF